MVITLEQYYGGAVTHNQASISFPWYLKKNAPRVIRLDIVSTQSLYLPPKNELSDGGPLFFISFYNGSTSTLNIYDVDSAVVLVAAAGPSKYEFYLIRDAGNNLAWEYKVY